MTAAAGTAQPPTAVLGLGLDIGAGWHQRAPQRSRVMVQTKALLPPPTAGGGRLRLPALAAKGPRRRSGLARLSLSEPSLLIPNEHVSFEGFSRNRCLSVSQRRPPPPPALSKSSVLLPCKVLHLPGPSQPHQQQVLSCTRPAYVHFSQAIQPSSKPKPARRHSLNPALNADAVQRDLRPLAMQQRNPPSQTEPLSISGKPYLPSCSDHAASGPARTQLHVFLPTEAEGEEADMESVDEGFMEELDSKISALKLRQGPKTLTYH